MKRREVVYYRERYLGSLDEETADKILEIRGMSCIDGLKNCIYDLDEAVVDEILEFGVKYRQQPEIEDDFIKIGTLEDSQTISCALLHTARRFLLTDSVGLGKTVDISALVNVCKLEKKSDFRYLFLTESTSQIQRKLIRFTGEYVHASSGEVKSLENWYNIVSNGIWCSLVATHSVLDSPAFFKWLYMNKDKFDLFVLDESWVVRKSTSNKHKVVNKLVDMFDRVVFLNATPLEMDIEDEYNQLYLIDKELLPTKTDFEKEYTNTQYYGGMRKRRTYKNEELFRKRVELRKFGNTRKALNAKFEENTGSVIFIDCSKEQKALMKRTTLWRMVCDCPTYLDKTIEFNEVNVPKLKEIRRLFTEELREEDTVYIYCYYKEAQNELKRYIESTLSYECEIINSDTRKSLRPDIIERFNNKDFKVLISNTTRQIDLTTCDYMILYSFDFNPAKIQQAEGRITREFDIVGKTVRLLCMTGKEENYLMGKIASRAKNMSKYNDMDNSIILEVLLKAYEERKNRLAGGKKNV